MNSILMRKDSTLELQMAGLPCVGKRLLSSDEMLHLQNENATSNLKGAVGCFSFVPVMFVVMMFLTSLMDLGVNPDTFLGMCIMVTALAIPVVTLLKANDFLQQAKTRSQTLKENCVLIFEGKTMDIANAQIKELAKTSTRCTVEALSSGEVLNVNAKVVPVTIRCPIFASLTNVQSTKSQVAFTPLSNTKSQAAFTPLQNTQRQLSYEETEELNRYARQQIVKGALPGIGFTLFLGACLGAVFWAGSTPRWESGATHFVLVWIISVFAAVKNVFAMNKLRADAHNGTLQQIVDDGGTLIEVLPRSGQVWTINAQPASWRTAQKHL